MKKIISLFLVLILMITVPISAYAEENTSETVTSAEETLQAEKNVDERAREILDSMTLEEKVAQMFMVYMPSKNATAIQKEYQFGGYLLFCK